ncbi:MAG: DUF6920 family protein [Aestuariivirga sp.]
MSWIKWAGLALLVLAALGFSLAACGSWRWRENTQSLLRRLEAARGPSASAPYDPREIDGLPLPVQRYFRAVLKEGQPMVTAATITQSGTFNTNEAEPSWNLFTASQRVTTKRPGFIWDARIAMYPGVPVHVHDAYIGGEGILHAALLGLFTLADVKGGRNAAQGELMRYLPEAAWYPTALLPRNGILWEAIDDTAARATISDGDWHVTMTFRFNGGGLIDTVHSEARSRLVGERVEMMPWQGRFRNYAERGGMKVPLYGEVEWLTPEGPRPYFRGTITSIAYQFGP